MEASCTGTARHVTSPKQPLPAAKKKVYFIITCTPRGPACPRCSHRLCSRDGWLAQTVWGHGVPTLHVSMFRCDTVFQAAVHQCSTCGYTSCIKTNVEYHIRSKCLGAQLLSQKQWITHTAEKPPQAASAGGSGVSVTLYPKFDTLLDLSKQYDPAEIFQTQLFNRLAAQDSIKPFPQCTYVGSMQDMHRTAQCMQCNGVALTQFSHGSSSTNGVPGNMHAGFAVQATVAGHALLLVVASCGAAS